MEAIVKNVPLNRQYSSLDHERDDLNDNSVADSVNYRSSKFQMLVKLVEQTTISNIKNRAVSRYLKAEDAERIEATGTRLLYLLLKSNTRQKKLVHDCDANSASTEVGGGVERAPQGSEIIRWLQMAIASFVVLRMLCMEMHLDMVK